MKGLNWGLLPYRLAFERPLLTGQGAMTHREGVWIAVADSEGRVGLGEAAPLPEWGTETLAEAARALSGLARTPWPEGDDPAPVLRAAGLDPALTPAAWAGAELAVLDLMAQRAGTPLVARWATPGRVAVPVNALLGAAEPETLRAEAAAAVAAGYQALKLKVGALPLAVDLARVAAAREAAGAGIALRLDANGAWGREEAVAALEAFAPYAPAYVEQPVAPDDVAGLAWVRDRAPVPVAADEALRDRTALDRLLAEGGCDVLVVKPMALGGLLRGRAIAEAAQAAGMAVVWTSVLDRGVATLGVVHLTAADLNGRAAGLATTGMFKKEAAIAGLTPVQGAIQVPTGPGLGAVPEASELLALMERVRHGHPARR